MHKAIRTPGVTVLVLVTIAVSLLPARTAADATFDALFYNDLAFAARQLANTAGKISTTSYPSNTTQATSGSWSTTGASGWTSGFFPGSLWLLYDQTDDPFWRTRAEQWQAGLESQKNNTSTHDVGFMIYTSFGNGYRLTRDPAYRQVLLTAANSLATRYDPDVRSIKSWNGPSSGDFRVIIDNMMNLELLFWAARNGGDRSLYDIALNHALGAREQHVRADGSTYQLVNYNPSDGTVQSKSTHQGYNTESTWSRGQAWAIYGFATSYRETGNTQLLETARQTADYFLDHLPSDRVPYWDFEAPGIPNEPRDSSAAAIAAAGLLELSVQEPDGGRKSRYLDAAKQILTALSSPAYLAEGTASPAILLHGTQNKPDGKYDRGLVYGDYYFLEALLRYRAIVPATTPPPPPTATTPANATPTRTPASPATPTRTPASPATPTKTVVPTATRTATPTPLPPPPAAPTSLTANAVSSTQINLAWVDNSNNEASFEVEYSRNGSSGWASRGVAPANATTASIPNLTASTTYYFRVKALGAGGESTFSDTASAATLSPAQPTATTAPNQPTAPPLLPTPTRTTPAAASPEPLRYRVLLPLVQR